MLTDVSEMRLDSIIASAADQLIGPLLRRALITLVFAIFVIVAVYQLTIAGDIALAAQYGDLNARLIIGAIYGVLAVISLVILLAMRGKTAKFASAPALTTARDAQVVMLVEAAMLGYALARKSQRAH